MHQEQNPHTHMKIETFHCQPRNLRHAPVIQYPSPASVYNALHLLSKSNEMFIEEDNAEFIMINYLLTIL